ncbi:unnamed protein product, partial [Didymodactylos carnosus]
MCPTRWNERYESVQTFYSLYESIIDLLDEVTAIRPSDSLALGINYHTALIGSGFIITLLTLNKLLSFTLIISKNVKDKSIDLMHCKDAIEDIVFILNEIRKDPDVEYDDIFEGAIELAQYTDSRIDMPRITKRQVHRNNVPAKDAKEHFKLNCFIPILYYLITSITDRFSDHVKQALTISSLIPAYLKPFNELIPSLQLYHDVLPDG